MQNIVQTAIHHRIKSLYVFINICAKLNQLPIPVSIEQTTDLHGGCNRGNYLKIRRRTTKYWHMKFCLLFLNFAFNSIADTDEQCLHSFQLLVNTCKHLMLRFVSVGIALNIHLHSFSITFAYRTLS